MVQERGDDRDTRMIQETEKLRQRNREHAKDGPIPLKLINQLGMAFLFSVSAVQRALTTSPLIHVMTFLIPSDPP